MRWVHMVALSALVSSVGCAAAPKAAGPSDVQRSYAEPSAYVAVGAAFASEQFDTTGNISADDALATSLRAGYRFDSNLAAEVMVEGLSDFDLELGGTSIGDVDGWNIGVNLRGYASTGSVQPYALIGIGLMDLDLNAGGATPRVNDSDLFTRLGLGVETIVSDDVIISLDGSYVIPFNDLDDFEYFTLGVGLGVRF